MPIAFCTYLLCLYITSLTSALPLPDGVVSDGQSPPQEDEDVFSRILRINKGLTLNLYHGDIIRHSLYGATLCANCLWPKSADGKVRVPYALSSDYSDDEKNLITEALKTFNTLSCIQFVERSTENEYLNVISGDGCWSYIGKAWGAQPVSLMKGGCMAPGIVQHEIRHALGFYHEQSRSDRDQYVDIMWQYIDEADRGEFTLVDTNNLDLPYDYFSVMHYGKYSFSNTSGQPSLKPKPDQSVEIGQRYGMSSLDVSKIKKLYNCNDCSFLLTGTSGSVDFDSSMSPYSGSSGCLWLVRVNRNKSYLQLSTSDVSPPTGCASNYVTVYDGQSRDAPVLVKRTNICQEFPLLVASGNSILVDLVRDETAPSLHFKASYGLVDCGRTYTTNNGTITSPGFPNPYPNLSDCISTIWAPEGFRIVLNFTTFDLEFSSTCLYDYLIINDGGRLDSPLLGVYCSNNVIPPITSTGNALLLEFRSDHWLNMAGYSADYYFVKSS